jgi:hypothetical protein
LLRYGVGVVDELEKIRSSLSRKFGCRCTITCAGGSASFGGSTSTGVHGAGAGDAQAQSTAVSISDIAPALCILVGHLLGMVLSYRCEVGGMRGFVGACAVVELLDLRGRGLRLDGLARAPGRGLELAAVAAALRVRADRPDEEADPDTDPDLGIQEEREIAPMSGVPLGKAKRDRGAEDVW